MPQYPRRTPNMFKEICRQHCRENFFFFFSNWIIRSLIHKGKSKQRAQYSGLRQGAVTKQLENTALQKIEPPDNSRDH